MLKSIRRSFGMSPSSSANQLDQLGNSDVPAGVLSPSNKPNTFVPLRRSNSFTNFFSSSRSTSPARETSDQSSSHAITPPTKASSSAQIAQTQTDSDAVLAYLVLLDKKGRQKERFPIQSLKTTMGRSLDNDVRFLVNDVSRHHCTIEIEIQGGQRIDGNKAFLQILGANGVLLNGTQVYPAPRGVGRYALHTGDSIVVAKRSFVFEFPQLTHASSPSAEASMFSSPIKASAKAGPQTPATSNRRRVRMSLVNAAQINTPARPSAKSASPSKNSNAERDARRANGLERFMQTANVSPSKANKNKSRQSLASSVMVTDLFGTPAKSHNSLVEPKQVSFSLYANSYTGRLSPVKQMRMMPPLDTMDEEQDGSFGSDSHQPKEDVDAQQEDHSVSADDKSSEDIVIVEELEQDQEELADVPEETSDAIPAFDDAENSENIPPPADNADSTPSSSPSKGGSPKRAKRRSSFFGRAGPFRGMSLGFYAEERTEDKEAQPQPSEPEQPVQDEEVEEEFSDASDVESAPMQEEELVPEQLASPAGRRVVSRSIKLGISMTPSPVKHQHFVGLTPLPRRPRLSLASRRKVSLRTQTLLRSSEAYSDRLFLPPAPGTQRSNSPSGLSKSMSMPNSISDLASAQAIPAFDTSSAEASIHSDDLLAEQVDTEDLDTALEPVLDEEDQAWKDSEDDEDEVDQSLSVLSPSPKKAPTYDFSPVKASLLPQFATPQPVSKTHSRRISMPPAGAADAKSSNRSALIRLQISGEGERIVHEVARKEEQTAADKVSEAMRSSPSKARRVVRVSDVGLPATELSMGFDLVEDAAAEPESSKIAQALNDLFTAEEEELTDDEEDEELEQQEEIVQISSKVHQSPSRPVEACAAPLQPPQTPAALNSMRHLFSAASAAPTTPDMQGLGDMLRSSPERAPQYGVLGDKMRANPEIVELLSPSRSSPRKKAMLGSSPVKGRRGVRRSQAAEIAVSTPATPRAAPAPFLAAATPVPAAVEPVASPMPAGFEAELHVTMFDASAMDAENEVLARALTDSEEQVVQDEHESEAVAVETTVAEDLENDDAMEEQPHASVQESEESEQASMPITEPEAAEVAEVVEEADAVSADVAPVQEQAASPEKRAVAEASPSKSRASRRAASASPTKRAARSASPTKRALQSSPIKRSAAPAAPAREVFAPNIEIAQETTEEAHKEEAQEEQHPVEEEVSSPSKPTRRTGSRKAKQAAEEAITATLAPAEAVQQSSPQKPTRRSKAAAAADKDEEAEPVQAEEVQESEQDAQNQEEADDAEVEEPPKRATRTRATRATAAAKPVRATRTRAAKSAASELPSSSAGYGDDEASEADESAKPKRTTRATRTTAATRGKAGKSSKAEAAAEATEVETEEDPEEQEEEVVAAAEPKTTRTRAAATRSTRAKSAAATSTTTAAAKGRGRAKASSAAEEQDAASSSTTTTTRSGRTTRRTAAAK
ncbi:FHA domain-containing protein [Pseudozyma hubeiensis]|nr:FHA domain-containing protein [Pseudozyma hubeiensis]